MEKIDFRKHYILMVDTETANAQRDEKGNLDSTQCLCYDIGGQVIDTHGNVYAQFSFVNSDIFYKEADLMKSAYYAKKLPQYHEDIKSGKRVVANTYQIRKHIAELVKTYKIKEICAHNARFDNGALNATQRWTTKSKYRYFLPYGLVWWDTMKMARDTIAKQPTYRKFCEKHNLITKGGKVKTTAEALYRYISKDSQFSECHTGLEDVQIEAQILVHCFRQHKPMQKTLYRMA